MPKFMTLMLLLIISVFLASCKLNNKAMLLGVWELDQISQKVGSIQRKYNEEEKSMNYKWITEKQILVQDSLFEIEFKKDQMVLKNKDIEIHYYKKRAHAAPE